MTAQARGTLAAGTAQAATVAPIWRLVVKSVNPIVPFNATGHGPPVFWIHTISGDVMCYRALAEALGAEQRSYGIQVPKAQMAPDLVTSVGAMGASYAAMLQRFQPEGPLLLAGWSAGAIIALETAQHLRALGRDVPLLIAIDGAPCNTGVGLPRWHPAYVARLVCNFPRWLKYEIQQSRSPRAFALRLWTRFAFRAGLDLPPSKGDDTLDRDAVKNLLVASGWLDGHMKYIRTLYGVLRGYVPARYDGRVLVYEADTEPLSHLMHIGEAWRALAPNCEIVRVAGSHGSVLQGHAFGAIAAHLGASLGALRARDCGGSDGKGDAAAPNSSDSRPKAEPYPGS